MKYYPSIPKIRIRRHSALLLAGILALGAGLSPVRSTDHYFIVSNGVFTEATNYSEFISGVVGGWTVIANWDTRGTANSTSDATLTMSGHAQIVS